MTDYSIEIALGEQTLQFFSLKEFEFALAGRTSLPFSKLRALSTVNPEGLLREVEGIRQLEQRLVGVLERSMNEPRLIGDFLADIDLSVITQDYQWRSVIKSLMVLGIEYDGYKKVALVKYLQYLAARQEIVRFTYSTRVLNETQDSKSGGLPPDRFPDTLIFDPTPYVPEHDSTAELQRLPKGETVEIHFAHDEAVNVVLAKHTFSILTDDAIHFLDDQQHDHVLRPGKNIVGRDASSDIVIDSNYRAVSRRHLIIETEGSSLVRLTDISSLGTFIPPEYLDRTGL